MSHPSRSRTRGWYPFWLGLLALGLVTWAWLAHDVPTPATTDAAPPVAAADAGAELPPEKPTEAELAWRIEGRGPIE
ncbi:MAG: hypothetical protein KC620_21110, partial [Myxococcales bacterium]|nr:hypothetical protein [Myxococcales bacterium]